MSYQENRAWSDEFIPEIKRIVGPHLLVNAPLELDTREATDLMVFAARDMRIAARVRRHGFAERYPYEFTIRSRLDSGTKTEFAKVHNGFGDWMFYGHQAAPRSRSIGRWFLIDLNAWREHLKRGGDNLVCGETANGDGTHFFWYDLTSFQSYPPILIAASHDIPNAIRADKKSAPQVHKDNSDWVRAYDSVKS